jgi:hypothetical protein
MLQDKKQDKIINLKVYDKDMFVNAPDGSKIPIKGVVTETYYESGRQDTHVDVRTALKLLGLSQ